VIANQMFVLQTVLCVENLVCTYYEVNWAKKINLKNHNKLEKSNENLNIFSYH
jgi:hypothetical protein